MTEGQPEPIIEQVPGITGPAPAEGVVPDASSSGQPLLTGPRETEAYTLPGGGTVSHEITGDGMKQTRVVGGSHRSAAEFHVDNGVGTQGEIDKVSKQRQEAADLSARLATARVIDPHQ